MVAILLFELGSIVCATAHTSAILIIGRLISGAGGGGLYVGTLTVVGYVVPTRKRPVYISVITSMFGAASVAGPLLGGAFTDSERLTWRFCFWINLRKSRNCLYHINANDLTAIGLVAFLFTVFTFQSPKRSRTSKLHLKDEIWKLDPMGVCFLISAFVCLLLALQWAGTTYSWSNSLVWGCLLGFGLLLTAFVATQIWRKDGYALPQSTSVFNGTKTVIVQAFLCTSRLKGQWQPVARSFSFTQ